MGNLERLLITHRGVATQIGKRAIDLIPHISGNIVSLQKDKEPWWYSG